jgi:nicotinamide mononucleotide transporter
MELLAWIATVISVVGVFLNARKNIICWPIWLISNILWIIYFFLLKNNPSIVLWIVFSFFNIYGWTQWSKDKNKINESN